MSPKRALKFRDVLNPRTRRRIANHIANLAGDADASLKAERYLIRYYGSRAVPQLLEQVAHESEVVRYRVAYILGKSGDSRAFEPLAKLLQDPCAIVQYDAAIALGDLGDTRAISLLVSLVENDDTELVDGAAAQALSGFRDAALDEVLRLVSAKSQSARCIAVDLLASCDHPKAKAALAVLSQDADLVVRTAVEDALEGD